MKKLHTYEKIRKLHEYIEQQQIITPEELASHLGVSRRRLFEMIDYLKDLGACIYYDRKTRCYRYNNDFQLFIEIKIEIISDGELQTIVGGTFLETKIFEENTFSARFLH